MTLPLHYVAVHDVGVPGMAVHLGACFASPWRGGGLAAELTQRPRGWYIWDGGWWRTEEVKVCMS
jgi:hypothetical protein